MKLKISVVILFVFTFYLGANSQILLTENFDYTAGDSIGAHGWVAFSGTTNNIKVVSPGLTYTGYPQSGIGNSCRLSNYGIDSYMAFTTVSSGSLYCSFMLNVDSILALGGDYCFAMLPSTSTTNFTSRFYVKDSLGGVMFGITKGAFASNPVVWTTSSYLKNTTYLIVIKYKFNTGTTTDDELSVFVLASPNLPVTEPTTPTIGPATFAATDAADLGRVALRQGSSTYAPTVIIDGIKVATNWSGIVSNVKPISTVAEKFALSQNYPNPFNPVTNINFSIPTNGNAKLSVYNALGQQVQSLLNGSINAGTYSIQFDGKNLNSGLYFYKLELSSKDGKYFSDVKKLMLVK
jgi:hypothetical protein